MITKRSYRLFVGLIGLLLPSGCAHFYDPIDASLSCLHCEVEAAKTWHYLRGHYAHVNDPHHFGAGFRAGYVNVCRGRGECPPTLPPKCYWTVWYRNAAGRAKTLEWFNGFSAGAAVAMQAGHAHSGELMTAPGGPGKCDGYANQVEIELPAVRSHSEIPAEALPPAQSPWQLRDVTPEYVAPPDFADEFESAPAAPPTETPGPPLDSGPPSKRGSARFPAPEPAPSPPLAPEPDRSGSTAVPSSRSKLPLGHSLGPATHGENDIPETTGEQPPGEDVDSDGSADAASTKPVPDSSTSQEGVEAPKGAPRVPDFQAAPPPPSDIPPLENRFLPRGGASPGINSSRHSRPPRSLLEAIGRDRIQHTSHTARSAASRSLNARFPQPAIRGWMRSQLEKPGSENALLPQP